MDHQRWKPVAGTAMSFFSLGVVSAINRADKDVNLSDDGWYQLTVGLMAGGLVLGIVALILWLWGRGASKLAEKFHQQHRTAQVLHDGFVQFAVRAQPLLHEGEALLAAVPGNVSLYASLLFKWSERLDLVITQSHAEDLTGDPANFPPNVGSTVESVTQFAQPRLEALRFVMDEAGK